MIVICILFVTISRRAEKRDRAMRTERRMHAAASPKNAGNAFSRIDKAACG